MLSFIRTLDHAGRSGDSVHHLPGLACTIAHRMVVDYFRSPERGRAFTELRDFADRGETTPLAQMVRKELLRLLEPLAAITAGPCVELTDATRLAAERKRIYRARRWLGELWRRVGGK